MHNATTFSPPTTMSEITAHLVDDHRWPLRSPVNGENIQAHRYAHGADGRPDLVDAGLDHTHTVPKSWPAPAVGPPPGWVEGPPAKKIRPLTGVILGWNALMATWLVYALFSTGALMGKGCVTEACQTGVTVGAGIAVVGILFLTAVVDVILAVIWMVTKKD